MNTKQNIPELRFKGGEDIWEKLTLGDLGSVAMNKRIFKHQTSNVGDVPFFKIGTFGKEPDAYISRELFEEYKSKYPYPNKGDLLLSASGSIGKVVEYKGEDQYFQDSNIVWLKHDGKIENSFLKVFYSQAKWSGLEGSTIKRLYNKNILDTEIYTPSKCEQTEIGNYFQKLDTLINQHQQKHDKLSNLKKAMLEKMFPKVGESVPEIRFDGFSGDWMEKVLEDVCDVRDGTHASPQYQKNGFPLITSKNVKNGYINYDEVQYISKIDFDEINKRSKVDVNDILMGMIGTIGNIALIRQIPDFAIKNVALIKDKNLINFLYSYYFLQSPIATQLLEDCASGGTQKFISLNNVRRLLTCFPEREEQTAIGNYFQKLDVLIDQHQQQITKLKNIKQACLDKMFV